MSTKRNTVPIITKYELARILSARAAEIANGDPITIQNPGTSNPYLIAQMEYNAGKIPFKVKRVYVDGSSEVWSVSEFIKK